MLDKIKSIVKRDDSSMEAPKELPDLLYEGNNPETIVSKNETIDNEVSENQSVDPVETPPQEPVQAVQKEQPVAESQPMSQPVAEPQPTQQPIIQTTPQPAAEPQSIIEQTIQQPASEQAQTNPQELNQPKFMNDDVERLNEEVTNNISQRTQGQEFQQVNTTIPYERREVKIDDIEPEQVLEENIIEPEVSNISVQQEEQPLKEKVSDNIEEFKKRIFVKSENNFFRSVESAIKNASDSPKIQELLNQDLFQSMKIHHKKSEEYDHIHMKINEIENQVNQKIIHMEVLEDEWLTEKRNLELQEKIFMEKEEEVFQGVEELKFLFSKLDLSKKLNKKVDEEKQFILSEGQRIESFASLITNLKMMSDETFSHHVNIYKNDFAKWIKHVYGAKDLAKNMKKAKSRLELINLLEQV